MNRWGKESYCDKIDKIRDVERFDGSEKSTPSDP